MGNRKSSTIASVERLKPREPMGADIVALSPFSQVNVGFETCDTVCTGLEEIARHLRWLEDDYNTHKFERLGARARSVVLLADQLGLRSLGHVAADVIYCLNDPDNAALPATLSRLMRLMAQALDHAAGSMAEY